MLMFRSLGAISTHSGDPGDADPTAPGSGTYSPSGGGGGGGGFSPYPDTGPAPVLARFAPPGTVPTSNLVVIDPVRCPPGQSFSSIKGGCVPDAANLPPNVMPMTPPPSPIPQPMPQPDGTYIMPDGTVITPTGPYGLPLWLTDNAWMIGLGVAAFVGYKFFLKK